MGSVTVPNVFWHTAKCLNPEGSKKFGKVTCLKQTFSESFMCLYLLRDNQELLIFVVFVKVRRDFNFSGCFFYPVLGQPEVH